MSNKKRDELANKLCKFYGSWSGELSEEGKAYKAGFDSGYAMAEKRGEGLVEAIKKIINADGSRGDVMLIVNALAKYDEEG